MKRNSLLVCFGALLCGALFLWTLNRIPGQSSLTFTKQEVPEISTLFPYQCIDTMKVSRDKARELMGKPQSRTIISNQVQTIASLGANCIAIGTPYDPEFLPYLALWVTEARKAHLAVWFRGNFSSWEGWFDYPKSESTEDHIAKTEAFIVTHPDLFRDGDIFSPIVEPENGGPFAPVDTEVKISRMRSFLIAEQAAVTRAFTRIHKSVTTDWISMSGGVANAVLDDTTVSTLHNTVTLDHYVAKPQDMTVYITDFSSRFGSHVVLGEFGAPIPDINGSMSVRQQAAFVESLLQVLYVNRDIIAGVNYWTLSESSTALINDDMTAKPVVEVLKKYYQPATIHVIVVDRNNKPLSRIPLIMDGQDTGILTDSHGQVTLTVPQGNHRLQLIHPDGSILIGSFTAHGHDAFSVRARFVPEMRFFIPLFNFLQYF